MEGSPAGKRMEGSDRGALIAFAVAIVFGLLAASAFLARGTNPAPEPGGQIFLEYLGDTKIEFQLPPDVDLQRRSRRAESSTFELFRDHQSWGYVLVSLDPDERAHSLHVAFDGRTEHGKQVKEAGDKGVVLQYYLQARNAERRAFFRHLLESVTVEPAR